MTRRREQAVRITTVGPSRADDIRARQRRYLISMAIRTACFVGAVVVGPGWLRWVLVAAAIFLPYVAVVAANANETRDGEFDLPPGPTDTPELPQTPRRENGS